MLLNTTASRAKLVENLEKTSKAGSGPKQEPGRYAEHHTALVNGKARHAPPETDLSAARCPTSERRDIPRCPLGLGCPLRVFLLSHICRLAPTARTAGASVHSSRKVLDFLSAFCSLLLCHTRVTFCHMPPHDPSTTPGQRQTQPPAAGAVFLGVNGRFAAVTSEVFFTPTRKQRKKSVFLR